MLYCILLHAVDESSGGGGVGPGGGQGRDQGEGAPRREYPRTRGVSGVEREVRRKKGGRGVVEASVAAADRLLTMDVELSAIRITVRMISSLDEARRRFFVAPVGAAVAEFPSKRAVAYVLYRLEGAVAVGAAR